MTAGKRDYCVSLCPDEGRGGSQAFAQAHGRKARTWALAIACSQAHGKGVVAPKLGPRAAAVNIDNNLFERGRGEKESRA